MKEELTIVPCAGIGCLFFGIIQNRSGNWRANFVEVVGTVRTLSGNAKASAIGARAIGAAISSLVLNGFYTRLREEYS